MYEAYIAEDDGSTHARNASTVSPASATRGRRANAGTLSDIALPAMERGDQWHWTLRLREHPDALIGRISLMRSETENRGFWLGLPWQRQGLMTEAYDVVTRYWFQVLGFPVLRVPKAAANVASRRISEKQGMRLVAHAERDYVCGRLPAEIWEITTEEWRRVDSRKGRSSHW